MAQTNNNLFKHAFALFSLIPLIILIAVVLAERSATNSDNATAEKDIQRMEKLQKAKEYVDKLNEAQNYWTPVVRENFVIMDRKPLKKMANGPIETPKQQNKTQQRKANESTITLPSKFDAREKWPECADFIGMVTHKGFNGSVSCGAGWAHSAAAVLTDRICIERLKKGIRSYTNHASSFASVQDTMESQSCDCTNGNNAPAAWRWFAETGVVTGTNYTMGLGCKPYIYPPESNLPLKTTGCRRQCDKQLPFNYRKGKVFKLKGAPTHWEGTDENREEKMMREIMTNGPIQATVDGYYDLLNYGKSSKRINVYVHTNEKPVFAHSLKLIGWGEQTTDKGELVKYWNGVNSFGTDWGLNGLFKWRRGTNECRIESFDINFGTPDV
ncbi:hypothetical protein niasHS_007971 [Heterodera schachtii]|uniref:Peptidase C1A papain C-terminal domain-containing protein n=1 Tax=Heterodera schachtii TaxID=97005 RepID=A0ABD2JQ51_HETSC